MAQTIIGLDIGSFSVKVVTMTASFRSMSWTGFREYEIPHGERDRPHRAAAEVLRDVSENLKSTSAFVVTALPGDRVMSRFVTLPFDDPKRLDSVLGFELEAHLPLGVEDMLYSYQVADRSVDGEAEIFAAAVTRDYMQRHMDSLQDAGLDPRIITLDSTVYLNLYDHLEQEGTVAFVDVGHRTTNICVVEDGVLRMARSIGRGGMAVTKALAEQKALSFEEAESLKHSEGALPFGELPGDLAVAQACANAMQPLVLGIRQSILAHQQEHSPVERVIVCGGGARLRSFLPWLQGQLGVPVKRMAMERLEFNKSEQRSDEMSSATKGVGLALTQAASTKHLTSINFRRGQFGYEGDFQFLKDKLVNLAAMAVILLCISLSYAWVKNRSIQQQLDHQYDVLGQFTEQYLGNRSTSFNKTMKQLSRPPSTDDEVDLFPPMTAIAVLDKITQIQDEINTQAMGRRPGGPVPTSTPTATKVRRMRGELNRLRRRPGMPPRGLGDLPDPSLLVPPPRGATGRASFGPRRDVPGPGKVPIADREPVDPAKTGAPDDEKEKAEPPTKIELSIVDIDVFSTVSLTAETHESNVRGKERFRELIAQVPCFRDVKRRDIGPVVAGSGGRHGDWVRFEVTFAVSCPKAGDVSGDKKKKKDKSKGAKS